MVDSKTVRRPNRRSFWTRLMAVLNTICDGTLPPGDRVTQEDIAPRLGVSRRPVAQAPVLFKSRGFLKETGHGGLVVAHLDFEFFMAIYKLRSAIEPGPVASRFGGRTRVDCC